MNQPADRSAFSTIDMVRHLWRRRYLLLIGPPVFLVAGYFYTVKFKSQVFESSAMLKIRTPPSEMRSGPILENFDPPIYEDILKSPEVLKSVVEEARAEFPEFPRSDFESLRTLFEATVVTTRETVVVADYSPVVQMSVKADNGKWAYFLMDRWLDVVLERFGQLRALEAREMQTVFQAQYDELIAVAEDAQAREGLLRQQLRQTERMLEGKYNLLAGGDSFASEAAAGEGAPKAGLMAERVRLELAAAEEGDASSERLKSRLEKVNSLIGETMAEIEALGETQVSVSQQLEAAREELLLVRQKIEQVREVIAATTPDAAVLTDPLNENVRGQFTVLAWPIQPESTVSPPRAILAVGIALLFTVLLVVILLVEFFVRGALESEA